VDCPKCGAPGKAILRRCQSCGEVFLTADLVELGQLEHLLEQTDTWEVADAVREPYIRRLEALRRRMGLAVAAQEAGRAPEPSSVAPAEPGTAAPAVAAAAAEAFALAVAAALGPAEAAAPQPVEHAATDLTGVGPARPLPPPSKKEKVPFDQWLLSERNIKIALYSGGILLILAGLIFVGINWARIPGMGKFAVTVAVTALMYVGGYLLFRRPAFRIGGVALIAIALGFLTLNFVVLQTYVLGPRGLRDEVMWLIASLACLVPYVLTAYWTRNQLFSWFTLAALASAVAGLLAALRVDPAAYALAYSLMALAVLLTGRALQRTGLRDLVRLPALVAGQVAMPGAATAAASFWLSDVAGFTDGNRWLAVGSLTVAAGFYASTDVLYRQLIARWAASLLLALSVALAVITLELDQSVLGYVLMPLAAAYLGIGYVLERREQRRAGAWPFHAMAYVIASALTLMAIGATDSDMAQQLIGDVIILAISAAVHRDYRWIYGATWLFIAPIHLIARINMEALHLRGLVMGGLGLLYVGIGYGLGRRALRLGGPFISAAACITAIAVGFTWGNLTASVCTLVAVAVLYALVAVWRGWPWLLIPGLAALNLAVLPANRIAFERYFRLADPLSISYGILGAALALVGLGLRRGSRSRWAAPVYLIGALNMAGAYVASLILGGWLGVGHSLGLAAILLLLAWYEHIFFSEKNVPPILAYLGIAVVFVGHLYFVAAVAGDAFWQVNYWAAYSAALCVLYVALAWVVRRGRGRAEAAYGPPLRYTGLSLMAVPLAGSLAGAVSGAGYLSGVAAFGLASLAYGADAALRRARWLGWITVGVAFAGHFFVLGAAGGDSVWDVWPAYSAALCTAYVALAWAVRGRAADAVFGVPLRYAGLALMAAPLVGAAGSAGLEMRFIPGVIAFGLASLAYGSDAVLRRVRWLGWVAVGALFAGHFSAMGALGDPNVWRAWPVYSAGLCAAFAILGWLGRGWFADVFAKPLGMAGLWLLLAVPGVASVIKWIGWSRPWVAASSFGIGALVHIIDGLVRRRRVTVYTGISSFVVMVWAVFAVLEVTEVQAYVIPPGLALVAIGWHERARGKPIWYRLLTPVGLCVLMVSAFVQSLPRGEYAYALLLFAENLASIGWGIWRRSRAYVAIGVVALVANAIAQFGPGFVELPRWVQIGVTGAILLGGGLFGLFRRERILAARRRLAEQWREWEP
jgi:hypothetical protein